MRHTRLPVLAACLAAFPAASFADGGVLAKLGTLGMGVEFVYPTSKFTAVRGVVNGGSYDENATESGVAYHFDLEMKSGGVLIDLHPFGGVFFISGGLYYNKNRLDASTTGTGSVTVGNNTYTNPNLKGEVTFNTTAPYLGLGWGHSPEGKNFSMAFELGVLFQGSPEVRFTSSNGVAQSDLDREAADLEDSLKEYKYYPQIAFGFGYRF